MASDSISSHMLQSIFVINKDMMKRTQRVIGWEKINIKQVSDSSDTCRRLVMIILEELERLSINILSIINVWLHNNGQ